MKKGRLAVSASSSFNAFTYCSWLGVRKSIWPEKTLLNLHLTQKVPFGRSAQHEVTPAS